MSTGLRTSQKAVSPDLSEVHAVLSPDLDTQLLLSSAKGIQPRGVERGLARWRRRLPGLVWNDAALEGNPFTLPDVSTLLDGGAVPGYDDRDIQQVLDLSRAASIVETTAQAGPCCATDVLSASLNAEITAHEIIEPGVVRDKGRLNDEAVVNAQGTRFVALSGGAVLRQALLESLDRANSLPHPLASSTAWAALASYHQFYSNGNKRTARYVMNTVLLSHGFDAIVTPAARRAEYNQTLREMYIGGDVTGYALFLVGLYDDSH